MSERWQALGVGPQRELIEADVAGDQPGREYERRRRHASIFFTTAPWTSVSRKSRPWNRYVSFV